MTTSQISSSKERLGEDNSITSQPYGVCLTSCTTNKQCPKAQRCIQLYTELSQPLPYYVCAKEVSEGERCVNNKACQQGFSCVRYPKKDNKISWLCLKDCTQSGRCPSGMRCLEEKEDNKKICKKIKKLGETCSEGEVCEDGLLCIESQQKHYLAKCLKRCQSSTKDCQSSEVCRKVSLPYGHEDFVCFKKAKLGEECHHGIVCEDKKALCVTLTKDYAICALSCQSNSDCLVGQVCEAISSNSHFKICRQEVARGDHYLNLSVCANGGRALRFEASTPPVCFADCTSGDTLAPSFCGKLSSGNLLGSTTIGDDGSVVVGEAGIALISDNRGESWSRLPMNTTKTLRDVVYAKETSSLWAVGEGGALVHWVLKDAHWMLEAHSWTQQKSFYGIANHGKLLLIVGEKGTILRSEDSGKSWQKITLPKTFEGVLLSVAFDSSSSPTRPLALIVGEKGLILRSEDGGQHWKSIPSDITTKILYSVSFLHSKGLPTAVIVGENGTILLSDDKGKIWKKQTIQIQQDLKDIVVFNSSLVVVGRLATLMSYQNNQWKHLNNPSSNEKYHFFTALVHPDRFVILGELGQVFYTKDMGTHWSSPLSSLLFCASISLPSSPDVGACLLRCQPQKKGLDCPPLLRSCQSIKTEKGDQFFCMPSHSLIGDVKKGDRCSPYEGAKPEYRCAKGLKCLNTDDGYICMQSCEKSDHTTCSKGDICLFSARLKGWFCGLAKNNNEECRLSKHQFCKVNSYCHYNKILQKSHCFALNIKKEHEFCLEGLNVNAYCGGELVCVGSAATPFRHVCARRCLGNAGDCPLHWSCLLDKSGLGVCIEECTDETKCTIPTLQCRQPFSTDRRRYCI